MARWNVSNYVFQLYEFVLVAYGLTRSTDGDPPFYSQRPPDPKFDIIYRSSPVGGLLFEIEIRLLSRYL